MMRWGVRLDFSNCAPTSHTPIIIQEIWGSRDGTATIDSPGHARIADNGYRGSRL